jgi:hypothetical protein
MRIAVMAAGAVGGYFGVLLDIWKKFVVLSGTSGITIWTGF